MPFLAQLPSEALVDLAERAHGVSVPRGVLVVREGTEANTVYVVESGWAQVTASHAHGPVLLATLGQGDVFGEMGLLESSRRRAATVSSLTELDLLAFPVDAILRLLERYSDARAVLEQSYEQMLLINFLKRATSFANLDRVQLRGLAEIVKRSRVQAGEDIVRQGERGDLCFILRNGVAEVVLRAEDRDEQVIALLGTGALIGERSVLLDTPRSATVRALEECELLTLRRSELLRVMRESRDTASDILDVVRERHPTSIESPKVPHRVSGVLPQANLRRRLQRFAFRLVGQSVSLDQLLADVAREEATGQQLSAGQDLEDIRTHMGRLVAHWEEAGDRRCIFLRCYWHMTSSMVEALNADRFHNQKWVRELLERFSEYYFRALLLRERGSPRLPDAWMATFQLIDNPWVTVAEHLFLGINAHINRDLPLVLADMLTDLWSDLDATDRRELQEDYTTVNEIIAEAADVVVEDVVARYDPLVAIVSRVGPPVSRVAGRRATQFIASWRGDVWQLGIRLVEERDAKELERLMLSVEQRALNRVKPILSAAELRGYIPAGMRGYDLR